MSQQLKTDVMAIDRAKARILIFKYLIYNNIKPKLLMKTIYTFGNGKAEGRADMRDLLGGKGANLAEMNLKRALSGQ